MGKFDDLLKEYSNNLQVVFTEKQSLDAFKAASKDLDISDYMKKKVLNSKKIEIIWEDKPHQNLYVLPNVEMDFSVEQLLSAWTKDNQQYVSHYTAMYFLGIVLQRPRDFHLTKEIKSMKSRLSRTLNDNLVKQAFMKESRKTKQMAYYKGNTFYFHEKVDTNLSGINHFTFESAQFKISNLERTFLDVLFSPSYGGGIPVIFEAFANCGLNILNLIRYYRDLNPIYPIWQRVGFALDYLNLDGNSEFYKYFGPPTMDFYLDNNYRDGWKYNEKWKVYHPRGI